MSAAEVVPSPVPVMPAPATLIHRLTCILKLLDWESLFPSRQPVELELGSGDGSFLARYAALHPERNFVGVERLLGRLRKLDKKGRRLELRNLRLLRIEAAYLVQYLIAPESVHALHIYFPDPWPKRKHRKNRLINAEFTVTAGRMLAPGGTVYLRTDDLDYFTQMTEVFGANTDFTAMETPAELSAVVTDFERHFNAQGIATNRAAFRKLR